MSLGRFFVMVLIVAAVGIASVFVVRHVEAQQRVTQVQQQAAQSSAYCQQAHDDAIARGEDPSLIVPPLGC